MDDNMLFRDSLSDLQYYSGAYIIDLLKYNPSPAMLNDGPNGRSFLYDAIQSSAPQHVLQALGSAGACIDPEYEAEHANELRLWTAVLRGDLDELRRRIDAGDSVDQAPQGGKVKGWTALWLALTLGREDAARMLIQAGADLGHQGLMLQTPLYIALFKCSNEMILKLIEAGGACVCMAPPFAPYLNAAVMKGAEVVNALIRAGVDVNGRGSSGNTALHLTASINNTEIARVLIDADANVDATADYGVTPLHMASLNHQFEVTKLLIEAGANVTHFDIAGRNPTHFSLYSSSPRASPNTIKEIFTLLTDAGAPVDGATAKLSPLVPSDVIRAIVPEDTPFWLAANNDAPVLAVELAGGLDPNTKTENGMTLLHWACAGDGPECVLLLLDAGAEMEAGDHTPVFYCMHESSACLECLLSCVDDINRPELISKILIAPICTALAVNSPACVTALVGAGAWDQPSLRRTSTLCSIDIFSCHVPSPS